MSFFFRTFAHFYSRMYTRMRAKHFILLSLLLVCTSAEAWNYRNYRSLIELIRPYIEADDWNTAYRCVRAQAGSFRDDPYYYDLQRMLGEPIDSLCTVRLIDELCTNGNEFAPCLTGDGQTLYFCGSHRTDSLGKEDIYVSHLQDGIWQQPTLVRELSSREHNEAPVSVSADGTTMIFFIDGQLYYTDKTATGWGEPRPMPEAIHIARWQADAMLTADGRAILFAAFRGTRWESETSVNIFVSERDANGNWQEPQDLGPAINTPYGDRSPFLHPDGKTLYFCSEGHSTIGGYDVFKATKLYEDSWMHWTQPENLGRQINTLGKDCWYRISTDGTRAWFSSAKSGHDDLYEMTLPRQARPEAVATVTGLIADEAGLPVGTEVRWEDLETGQSLGTAKSDPANGRFFIVLPLGRNYGYFVNDQAYFPVADHLDLRHDSTAQQVEQPIRLLSIRSLQESGDPIRLTNLFFELDQATILPESYSELRRVAKLIRERELHIEISGHTDQSGSAAHNKDLSQRRAEAVRSFLIQEGCQAEHLRAVGYGSERPVSENDAENRRVELRIGQ